MGLYCLLLQIACTCLPFTFSRESVLSNELREVRAEHVLLQEDYASAIHCRDQALSEKADLQSKCQSQRSIIDTLNDQLERLVQECDSAVDSLNYKANSQGGCSR